MIDPLLAKHEMAKNLHDREVMAMLEKDIAKAIQKQADVDLQGQFHARVILYPGPRPKKERK